MGDVACYCRGHRDGESGSQWSARSRIVGCEYKPNQPEEDTPQTCWVVCDDLPVCVASDKLRPCTASELLAYQYLHSTNPDAIVSVVPDTRLPQALVDERGGEGEPILEQGDALVPDGCDPTSSDDTDTVHDTPLTPPTTASV